MKNLTILTLAALAGCSAQMSERANKALEKLDAPVAETQKVLTTASSLSFLISRADINNDDRLNSPAEWMEFFSGLVTLVEAEASK